MLLVQLDEFTKTINFVNTFSLWLYNKRVRSAYICCENIII